MTLTEYHQAHGGAGLRALADRAGLAKARLYEILRGHTPTVRTARRIAAASDGAISTEEVLGLTAPTVRTPAPAATPAPGDVEAAQ